jgi:hypothetical protein
MTITEQIETKINSDKLGTLYICADFYHISNYETIIKIFQRLTKKGTLLKVIDGIYMKPAYIESLGKYAPVNINDVAYKLAQKYNWILSPEGNTSLNILGLSTQVPAEYIYYSSGPYKIYIIDTRKLTFLKRADSKLLNMSKFTNVLISALEMIGKGKLSSEQKLWLTNRFDKTDIENAINEAKSIPYWIIDEMKGILNIYD